MVITPLPHTLSTQETTPQSNHHAAAFSKQCSPMPIFFTIIFFIFHLLHPNLQPSVMALPYFDRRIQSLFPVALATFLILGTTQLVLNALKANHSQLQQLFYSVAREEQRRLPVVLSKEDRMDEDCNVFEGQWVWDNRSYPLYTEESCPYLVKQVTCQSNGRPDSLYKNWKWQPRACELPRYVHSHFNKAWHCTSKFLTSNMNSHNSPSLSPKLTISR